MPRVGDSITTLLVPLLASGTGEVASCFRQVPFTEGCPRPEREPEELRQQADFCELADDFVQQQSQEHWGDGMVATPGAWCPVQPAQAHVSCGKPAKSTISAVSQTFPATASRCENARAMNGYSMKYYDL